MKAYICDKLASSVKCSNAVVSDFMNDVMIYINDIKIFDFTVT